MPADDDERQQDGTPIHSLSMPPRAATVAKQDPAARPGGLDQTRLRSLVGYNVTRADVHIKRLFAQHIGALQLRPVEYSILVLVRDNAEVTPKRLSLALGVSAPNLAIILDRLEERDLLARERSERDRRAVELRLSVTGRKLVDQAEAAALRMEEDILRSLSAGERAMLVELLQKVEHGRAPRRA